jgi:hypothetical protein
MTRYPRLTLAELTMPAGTIGAADDVKRYVLTNQQEYFVINAYEHPGEVGRDFPLRPHTHSNFVNPAQYYVTFTKWNVLQIF